MVRVLLRAGHTVIVWNCTASRADGVIAAGAVLAGSPTEAVESSELVVLSLTDYQAMWDIFEGTTTSLAVLGREVGDTSGGC